MTIGKDVIVNISTYNHQLGYKWIKPFFPESNFFAIHCEDNHIDGDIIREGSGTYGTILYSLTGDSIREGNGLLNKICGHLSYESGTLLIREGTTSFGKILCNITQY